MAANNLYKLNGLDVYTTYGFAVSSGRDGFVKRRKAKPRFKNSWPELNGDEYDLTEPIRFEDRTFNLKGYIMASSLNEFKAKEQALFDALNVPGVVPLTNVKLNITVNVIYQDMASAEILTKIPNGNGKMGIAIELVLQEVQQS
ncbi:hypothetical protein [Pedobacter nototheniae]|uniref:hypothetical protein n=1 Tax=Pedobacter nototheniae TaxID=2488994 RepID=UPI00103F17EF|nr:hypothetical protein [Pedobacter nototheniae]